MSYAVEGEDGTVTITTAAFTQIVLQAAEGVEGARVRRPRRHLDVEVADGRARVELELAVRYGLALPEVVRDVQAGVAGALRTMCGVDEAFILHVNRFSRSWSAARSRRSLSCCRTLSLVLPTTRVADCRMVGGRSPRAGISGAMGFALTACWSRSMASPLSFW